MVDKKKTKPKYRVLNEAAIREDAVTIDKLAEKAAGEIAAHAAQLPPDAQLYVPMGEDHDMPARRLFMLNVLQRLQAKTPIAVCFEASHNLREDAYTVKTNLIPGKVQQDFLQAQDRTGALSVQSLMYLRYTDGACEAQAALFGWLLSNKVPVRFTDAAFTEDHKLDTSDLSTAAALKACFKAQAKKMQPLAHKAKGIYARNAHMAARALAFAKETKARIIIHQCGNGHLAGDTIDKYPGAESLGAELMRSKAQVLLVATLSDDFQLAHIPEWRKDLPAPALVGMQGLPQWYTGYDPHTGAPKPGALAHMPTRAAETTYVAGVLAEWGVSMPQDATQRMTDVCSDKLDTVFAAVPR